jgi:hypothetical protein
VSVVTLAVVADFLCFVRNLTYWRSVDRAFFDFNTEQQAEMAQDFFISRPRSGALFDYLQPILFANCLD